jgi:hypothetical protein
VDEITDKQQSKVENLAKYDHLQEVGTFQIIISVRKYLKLFYTKPVIIYLNKYQLCFYQKDLGKKVIIIIIIKSLLKRKEAQQTCAFTIPVELNYNYND